MIGTHLGHSLPTEFEPDSLDVPRRVDLNVVLALGEFGLESGSQPRHVVDLAVDQNEV